MLELESSLFFGDCLSEADLGSDQKTAILTKKEVSSAVRLFKKETPGFEDPDDDMLDKLSQLAGNLGLD